MLNKIVKGIKLNVRYFKSILNDDNRLFYYIEDINEDGYIIRQNTNFIIKLKASFCCCQILSFGDRKVPFITIDGLFNEVSTESQAFFINHELGHFNLHQDLLSGKEVKLVRNDTMEFEADEFAMKIVGKEIAIKALEEMKEIIKTMNFGIYKHMDSFKEIDRRIENLMNK